MSDIDYGVSCAACGKPLEFEHLADIGGCQVALCAGDAGEWAAVCQYGDCASTTADWVGVFRKALKSAPPFGSVRLKIATRDGEEDHVMAEEFVPGLFLHRWYGDSIMRIGWWQLSHRNGRFVYGSSDIMQIETLKPLFASANWDTDRPGPDAKAALEKAWQS